MKTQGRLINIICIMVFTVMITVLAQAAGDILAAGFEGKDYDNGKVDVKKPAGKAVVPQIVDKRSGGRDYININQMVFSDYKSNIPKRPGLQTRKINLEKKYLLFPIHNGAKRARIDLSINGHNVREFDAELANTKEEANFWSFLDITSFKGKTALLKVNGATENGFALVVQSDEIPGSDAFYTEPLRPQFHFSQKIGWNNDPNGMVYLDGEWHLYFQHNPYGWKWGNMNWGHAVSSDLVHWKQLPIGIYNKRRGDWAFSGGAVVDEHNTSGWQTGKNKVIVASWTSTGRGECIAYSNDRGRTFTEYEGNPVIKHSGRDPKIVWYEPGKHWVLVVYDQSRRFGRAVAFYSSKHMKKWSLESRLKGYFECPEFFELPVDGDKNNTKWVVFAADARYAIGKFDGKKFTPDQEGKYQLHYGSYYASQTFSNSPGGRRIQIGWARIAMPGMPFNQTFTFPHRLTLRTTPDGIRMFGEPVKEISKLYKKKQVVEDKNLAEGKPVDLPVSGDLFDITVTFKVESAGIVGLDIGGERVIYNINKSRLENAPMKPVDGKVVLRVLIDRPITEICGNNGRVCITRARSRKGNVPVIKAFAEGGKAKLVRLEVNELNSIWNKSKARMQAKDQHEKATAKSRINPTRRYAKDQTEDKYAELAPTPPMGWNSWNIFHADINEKKIKGIADAMVSSGMRDAGYKYLVLDDGWLAGERDEKGALKADPKKFPNGMKAIGDYIHSKGLKFGIYEDRGVKTCQQLPGSFEHEQIDMTTFASWGVDYIKMDSCFAESNGRMSFDDYALYRNFLEDTGRPVVLSISDFGNAAWVWGGKFSSQLWRTGWDIQPWMDSIYACADTSGGDYKIHPAFNGLWQFAGPGHWNDPDMLQVGNIKQNNDNQHNIADRAHFSLWCILAAPLMAGNNLMTMTEDVKNILTAPELIAVNQDKRGVQGYKVFDNGPCEVYNKPLSDGTTAVLLLNKGRKKADIRVSWNQIGLSGTQRVRDLWARKELGKFKDSFTARNLGRHGHKMIKVGMPGKPLPLPLPVPPEKYTVTRKGVTYLSNLYYLWRRGEAPVYNGSFNGGPIDIGGRIFKNGFGSKGDSMIMFKLNGCANRLQAIVAIDKSYTGKKKGRFRVFNGDAFSNKMLWDSREMTRETPAKKIDIELKNVDCLRLVLSGRNVFGNWADVKVVSDK